MTNIRLSDYLEKLEMGLEPDRADHTIAHCKHILNTYPKNGDTYRLLGVALAMKERWDDAEDVFYRQLSTLPNDETAHFYLGRIKSQQENTEIARWHYEQVWSQNPDQETVVDILESFGVDVDNTTPPLAPAWALIQQGRYEAASDELEKLSHDMPGDLSLKLLLMETLWYTDRHADASNIALEVLHLLPYDEEANYVISQAFIKEDLAENAERYLTRLTQVDPYRALSVKAPDDHAQVELIKIEELDEDQIDWDDVHKSPILDGIDEPLPRISPETFQAVALAADEQDSETLESDELLTLLEDEESDQEDTWLQRAISEDLDEVLEDDVSSTSSWLYSETLTEHDASTTFEAGTADEAESEETSEESSETPSVDDTQSLLDLDGTVSADVSGEAENTTDEFVDFTQHFDEDEDNELGDALATGLTDDELPSVEESMDDTDKVGTLETEDLEIVAETSSEESEVVDIEPVDNAPDWLNAMVPGLDIDYEAREDENEEEEFIDTSTHRERIVSVEAESADENEFEWLTDIVEEEESAFLPAFNPDHFSFTKLPLWIQQFTNGRDLLGTSEPLVAEAEAVAIETEADVDLITNESDDLDWLNEEDFVFERDSQEMAALAESELAESVDSATDVIGESVDDIQKTVDSTVENMSDIAEDIVEDNPVVDTIEDIQDSVQDSDIASGVEGVIEDVKDAVEDNPIVDAIEDIQDSVQDSDVFSSVEDAIDLSDDENLFSAITGDDDDDEKDIFDEDFDFDRDR